MSWKKPSVIPIEPGVMAINRENWLALIRLNCLIIGKSKIFIATNNRESKSKKWLPKPIKNTKEIFLNPILKFFFLFFIILLDDLKKVLIRYINVNNNRRIKKKVIILKISEDLSKKKKVTKKEFIAIKEDIPTTLSKKSKPGNFIILPP